MSIRRIVIDTNILVAARRSRRGRSFQILSLLDRELFQICLSVPLVFEYEAVLKRPSLELGDQDNQDFINYLCSIAKLHEIYYLWRPLLRDAKDDLVLELAVVSGSSRIITFNTRDFGGCEKFGIRAIGPGEFLREIGVVK